MNGPCSEDGSYDSSSSSSSTPFFLFRLSSSCSASVSVGFSAGVVVCSIVSTGVSKIASVSSLALFHHIIEVRNQILWFNHGFSGSRVSGIGWKKMVDEEFLGYGRRILDEGFSIFIKT